METRQATDAKVIDAFTVDLLSGKVFANRVASARSRYGYEPPLSRRAWAEAMTTVAKMAAQSDAFAQVAANIRINLYGTDSQAETAIAQAFAQAVRDGYDDVIGRSGPEGGRHGVRAFTLGELVALVGWLDVITAPFTGASHAHGWVIERLASKMGMTLAAF